MPDIKITLDATTRLESSIYRLCEALERLGGQQFQVQDAPPAETATKAEPETEPGPEPATAPAATLSPDPTSVPVATEAPTYTREQVCKAGADLITAHPDKLSALQQLLTGYGVRGVANVPGEKLNEFATALRGLGAEF